MCCFLVSWSSMLLRYGVYEVITEAALQVLVITTTIQYVLQGILPKYISLSAPCTLVGVQADWLCADWSSMLTKGFKVTGCMMTWFHID